MTTEAPTPAPNRRADGTHDPNYKKPLAPSTRQSEVVVADDEPTEKDVNRTWRWQHKGDGRVTRLFCGDREVLALDCRRLEIRDTVGQVYERLNVVIGEGKSPTWDDEQAILALLNEDNAVNPGVNIYFIRKKGTEQYYQHLWWPDARLGQQGTRDPKWGPMTTAACWTTPNGPRPVKGSDGEIVSFQLGGPE